MPKRTYGSSCEYCRAQHRTCVNQGPDGGPCTMCESKGVNCVFLGKKRRVSKYASRITPLATPTTVPLQKSGGFLSSMSASSPDISCNSTTNFLGGGGGYPLSLMPTSAHSSNNVKLEGSLAAMLEKQSIHSSVSSVVSDGAHSSSSSSLNTICDSNENKDGAWADPDFFFFSQECEDLLGGPSSFFILPQPKRRMSLQPRFQPLYNSFSFGKAYNDIDCLFNEFKDTGRLVMTSAPKFIIVMANAEGGKIWSTRAFKDTRTVMCRCAARAGAIDILSRANTYQMAEITKQLFSDSPSIDASILSDPVSFWERVYNGPELVLEPLEIAHLPYKFAKQTALPLSDMPEFSQFLKFGLTYHAVSPNDPWFTSAEVPPPLARTPGETTKAVLLDAGSPDGIRNEMPYFHRGLLERHLAMQRWHKGVTSRPLDEIIDESVRNLIEQQRSRVV